MVRNGDSPTTLIKLLVIMNTEVTIVRIYLTETEKNLSQLLKYLHQDSQLRGVTVLRGISGFGKSGKIHDSHLLDLSFDLPIIVEFFDTTAKVSHILTQINQFVAPDHIVHWTAYLSE